jgi:hypothetical protein
MIGVTPLGHQRLGHLFESKGPRSELKQLSP